MSNIDLFQLVTASTKAKQAAAAHGEIAKAECKNRILTQFPLEAQQNIAQAITLYTLYVLRGQSQVEAGITAGLSEEDIAQAAEGRKWIAAMQETCRALSQELGTDPHADTVWPVLPEAVARLIARF